jgi:hypothetical protein
MRNQRSEKARKGVASSMRNSSSPQAVATRSCASRHRRTTRAFGVIPRPRKCLPGTTA